MTDRSIRREPAVPRCLRRKRRSRLPNPTWCQGARGNIFPVEATHRGAHPHLMGEGSRMRLDEDEQRQRFTDYVTARRDAVRRTAYLICGDWHWADDLTQTAFI